MIRKFITTVLYLSSLILTSTYAATPHDMANAKSVIEKSANPAGIQSKVKVHDQNGNAYDEDIIFMDLDENEIKELYDSIDDYLSDPHVSDEFYTRGEQSSTQPKIKKAATGQQQIITPAADESPKESKLILSNPVYPKGKEEAVKKMPVFSQGKTDTCATFSSTAAIDIVYANGNDQYSILRSLQLGKAISEKKLEEPEKGSSNFANPWNGQVAENVLAQIELYGLVKDSRDVEDHAVREKGFSEKSEKDNWPSKSIDPKAVPETFSKIDKFSYVAYEKDKVANKALSYSDRVKAYSRMIKNEIDKGRVVVVGLDLLTEPSPDDIWNDNGMSATVSNNDKGQLVLDLSKKEDTDAYNCWDVFQRIAKMMKDPKYRQKDAAHAMFIIGYCDNPAKGQEGKGLFILRNSWGKDNGIAGNNFATYDYVYTFNDEALSVGSK